MSDRVFWLCADDYGISESVSAGICQLVAARRVSAVSAMSGSPTWPRAACALRDLGARIEVGLHVDLTHFRPLGAMPRFAPGGRPAALAVQIAAGLRGALPIQEIVDEIRRQLDRFEAEYGAPPDYIDGHQHIHALPGIRSALFKALASSAAIGKPWLRDPADAIARIAMRAAERPKAVFVAALSNGFASGARARGFRLNEGFAGFSAFDPKRDFACDFATYLTAPGVRHLVMCHPGMRSQDGASARGAASRTEELRFLLSDEFIKAMEKKEFCLATRSMFAAS